MLLGTFFSAMQKNTIAALDQKPFLHLSKSENDSILPWPAPYAFASRAFSPRL
jgi:hypothetical protein